MSEGTNLQPNPVKTIHVWGRQTYTQTLLKTIYVWGKQNYSQTLLRLSMSEGDKPTAKPCYGWQSIPTEYKTYSLTLLWLAIYTYRVQNLQPNPVKTIHVWGRQTYSQTLSRLSMPEGDKPTAKPCYGWQSIPTEYKTYSQTKPCYGWQSIPTEYKTYNLTLSRLSMSEGDKPTAKPCYGWQSIPTEYKTYSQTKPCYGWQSIPTEYKTYSLTLSRLSMSEGDKPTAKPCQDYPCLRETNLQPNPAMAGNLYLQNTKPTAKPCQDYPCLRETNLQPNPAMAGNLYLQNTKPTA